MASVNNGVLQGHVKLSPFYSKYKFYMGNINGLLENLANGTLLNFKYVCAYFIRVLWGLNIYFICD